MHLHHLKQSNEIAENRVREPTVYCSRTSGCAASTTTSELTMNFVKATVLTAIATATLIATYACGGDGLSHEIAFVLEDEDNQLFLLETNGETSKIVNEPVENPVWSPNQGSIAFLAEASNGTGQLKIWDRSTEDDTRVPDAPNNVSKYFWSPDSRKIAYQTDSADTTEVFVHDFDEDKTTLLVSEPAGNVELGNWSGDNEWVVMRIKVDGGDGIYMRSVNGVNEVQLTDYPDSRPRFSFDGRRVAFARTQSDDSTEIYTLVVDTGDGPSSASALTDDDGNETEFEWAPNGRDIIYLSERDGNSEIYSIDTDDKKTRRLTQNRVPDSNPIWSLNGKQILFRSEVDGKNHLFAMDFKSGSQERIYEDDSNIVDADW